MTGDAAKGAPDRGVAGRGKSTDFSIRFLDELSVDDTDERAAEALLHCAVPKGDTTAAAFLLQSLAGG